MNRSRAEAGAQRGAKVADLERMKRDRSKLLDALVAGVPAAQLKDRMGALDGRRRALQAELSGSRAPVLLHPGMAELCRQKVRALVEGVNDPEHSSAVPEAIRALVHRIALTPVLRPGKKRATPTVGLGGALAAILSLAAGTKTKATSHAAAGQVSNAKKPASGEEAGF